MKFVPFTHQVEIEPIKKKETILSDGKSKFLDAGKVIAVGDGVTFVKVGDIIHFEPFGCSKTAKVDGDGNEHYVVLINEHVVRGKHVE